MHHRMHVWANVGEHFHAQLMWCLLWQEKGELLRRWVSSGENLQACEAHIEAARTNLFRGRSIKKLVPIKDMSAAPYSFSALLDCNTTSMWD